MKRHLILLMCIISVNSYAQNVGIGTKNPQNKLHVAGGLRIDSLGSKKDTGLILHNVAGDLYSISLTGNKSDVLRGDGTFSTAAPPTIRLYAFASMVDGMEVWARTFLLEKVLTALWHFGSLSCTKRSQTM